MSDKRVLGYSGGKEPTFGVVTAEVVNIKDDPEKACRVQIRIVGHQSDQMRIPDEKLQWARPMSGTDSASLSGAGTSPNGLLPGSRVKVLVEGENEFTILGSLMGNQDVHPMVKGHEESDHGALNQQDHGWNSKNASEVTTTNEERKQKRNRGKSKVDQGQKESKSVSGRAAAKDLGSEFLSIGRNLVFDQSQNAQQFIQDKIQNKAAIVPQALQMIEQLKQVKGSNPTSIQAVGAGNLMGAMQMLQKLFSKDKKKKDEKKTEEEKKREEELLKQIEEDMIEEQNNG